MTAARQRRVALELVKPSWPRGETPRSKVGVGNGVRRPEGGRWVRRSEEPPVTRRDARHRAAATGVRASACKGTRLVEVPQTRRGTEEMTTTSIGVQELRTRIGEKAKAEPQHRFWGLYTHVWKLDVLREAYRLAKKNHGAPGVDGVTFEQVEAEGVETFARGPQPRAARKELRAAPLPASEHPEGGRQGQGPEDPGHPRSGGAGGGAPGPGAHLRGGLSTRLLRVPPGSVGA